MSFDVYYNSQDNNSHVWANQHFQTSSCKRYPELITIATGSPFLCRAPPPPGSGEAEQRTPSTVLSIRGPGLFTTFPRCGFLVLSTSCSFSRGVLWEYYILSHQLFTSLKLSVCTVQPVQSHLFEACSCSTAQFFTHCYSSYSCRL